MEADGSEEEDDFQTDEDKEMEVDKQVQQKRKKVCKNFSFFFLMNFCEKSNVLTLIADTEDIFFVN